MKLTKLTKEQLELLEANRERFVNKFLNNEKIDEATTVELVGFIYSMIEKPMPKIFKASNPLQAQLIANELNGTKNTFYSFGTYLTIYWSSFYSYYETFVDLGIITEEKFPKYFKLRKFIESNIFLTIEFEGAIIVCEKPTICKKSSSGLHCVDGPAIQWEDGYGQYYVNGRNLSEKHFKSISDKTFKMEDFIKEENEEQKSTCIALMQEKYGDEYLVNFFREHLKEVDTFIDKKDEKYLKGTTGGMNVGVYTLFKGNINNEKIAFVRCYCPSTDRMFFLGVGSEHNSAKDAIASLYRIPSKLKSHIKSISRQGERFSTILTDEGNGILKKLTEKEIQDVVSINGDSYFDLIKYEY